jgi:hypothetical protein
LCGLHTIDDAFYSFSSCIS